MRYLFFFLLIFVFSSFKGNNPGGAEKTAPSQFYKNGDWNVTLKDTSGQMVSLSDFKGKFIYVDLWASWCKPCLREFDYTRNLQEKFKESNIVWVFISFDNSEESWKRAVAANGIEGIHLYGTPIKEEIKKALDVRGIPRYVWLDSRGSILMHDAPRPSENGTARQLKSYLKY